MQRAGEADGRQVYAGTCRECRGQTSQGMEQGEKDLQTRSHAAGVTDTLTREIK